MATSSILRNVRVTDRTYCRSLVNALEKSEEEQRTGKEREVTISKKVEKLSEEQIMKIFGGK